MKSKFLYHLNRSNHETPPPLFTAFFMAVLMLSCSKKADPDPRDNYIGTYNVTSIYIVKNTTTGASANGSSSYSVYVSKGSAADELVFQDDNDTFSVKLSGASFTVNTYNSNQKVNGSSYAFAVTGSGSFNSKNLAYSETYKGSISNNNYQINTSVSGNRP